MKKQSKDSLGDRMKRYEAVSKTTLVQRMPVILRLDGCHFHTFTKGFEKPFDDIMIKSMQDTMKYLCENIQGCVFGYTQSDEITLVLVDYKNLNSSQWFDNEVQKMCSVAASMAGMFFIRCFAYNALLAEVVAEQFKKYENAIARGAYFDCRAFNVPKEDVVNCLLWRIRDCVRNSVLSLAQAKFSHKEIQNKNISQLKNMLLENKNINWDSLTSIQKYGSICIKNDNWKIIEPYTDIDNYNAIEEFLIKNNILYFNV